MYLCVFVCVCMYMYVCMTVRVCMHVCPCVVYHMHCAMELQWNLLIRTLENKDTSLIHTLPNVLYHIN